MRAAPATSGHAASSEATAEANAVFGGDSLPPMPDLPPEASADFFAGGAPPASAQRAARVMASRWFFGSSAAICFVNALLFSLWPAEMAALPRLIMVAGFLLLGVGSLAALRLPLERAEAAMLAATLLAVLVISGSSLLLGWGVTAPGLGFLALLVCFVAALCPPWHAGVAFAGSLLAIAALAAVQTLWQGALPLNVAPPPADLGLRLVVHLMALGAGLLGGLRLADVLRRYARVAAERERRFRGLLGLAADAYWEVDADYRLVAASLPREDGVPLGVSDGIGERPWQLPHFGCDAELLDQVQADLDARHAFRDLPVTWRVDTGHTLHLLVSGEPRLDEQGRFLGYWGVARNVSAAHRARQALAATETRYQELFACIPSPLVLHRGGRILDANPAALAMFGHAELESMLQTELLSVYEPGDSRERARGRDEQLVSMPLGEPLPVAEFRLIGRAGRALVARATAVRVESDGQPASLSIFVDDTERKAAEDAVRRSETLLSHLVASSPDIITLTELESGRFVMVNQTFERLIGWSANEVIGRNAIDLGIWRISEDRERFVAALRTEGRVRDMAVDFVTRDGQPVSMLASGARFTLDRRDYLVINARDVSASERARLEREAILDNTSLGVAVTRRRHFVMTNPALEQMYGWPAGGLLGQSARVVWGSDEDYEEVGRAMRPTLLRGESMEVERTVQRRDGSPFRARIVGKAIYLGSPGHGMVWIVEDVTEQHRVADALRRARDEAEAASRAKSAFLANTSHELRTPLNGMLGLAQLARVPGLDEQRRGQYLEQIVDSAQSLAEILSDILDLSKIEAGKLHTVAEPFDLRALLHALQRGYATLAQARGLTLALEIGPGLEGQVNGDALRVRQILSNYLTNALKFTEQGGVRLRVGRQPAGAVRFEVEDSGPGIDEVTQHKLFKPFSQADDSTTRRFGGAGLGLSICRELAHLMGGEVGVVSGGGAGSCFWVELPLPLTAPAAPPRVPSSALALGPALVLLAEDNPVNMMIATAMLENWGVQVQPASDGRQAVIAVRAAAKAGRPFDAVLMDLQMPVMSGYEATRELRLEFDAEQLPIVALTAAAMVSEREQALAAGMGPFLTKPIDAERLRETLAQVLAGARARQT